MVWIGRCIPGWVSHLPVFTVHTESSSINARTSLFSAGKGVQIHTGAPHVRLRCTDLLVHNVSVTWAPQIIQLDNDFLICTSTFKIIVTHYLTSCSPWFWKRQFHLLSPWRMFIEGVYLHARLVTNVFDKPAPFKLYYFVGWGNQPICCPSILIEHLTCPRVWRGQHSAKLNGIT